jgi:hypothetical protein
LISEDTALFSSAPFESKGSKKERFLIIRRSLLRRRSG